MTEYERLVWRNARIIAKKAHMLREGKMPELILIGDMANAGLDSSEIAEIIRMSKLPEETGGPNVEFYFADSMGYDETDDGVGLGTDALFDEGIYEEAKDAFRRIHDGKC